MSRSDAEPAADRHRTPVGEELSVEGVTVRYGETVALDDVTLRLAPGEVVAVLGPSGSGKSTLLRAVAGLEPPVAGRVVLGGRDLAGVPTHRRGLGMMFQDHGLFTHLDVAGNVAYGLRIAGVPSGERRRRVAELLELVGLTGMAGRRPHQLSGGEAQRVALARALAPEPGLLMLDEPLGSLDRALRDQLVDELRRLLARLGQTALHVTHDQAEAFALADRVAVIEAGRLVVVDRPARLWADPGTRFLARFLGHPNLWSVEVDGVGTVRLGSVVLGVLGPEHPVRAEGPGRIDVVLPTTAVEVAPATAEPRVDRPGGEGGEGSVVEVRVDEVVFGHGRHRVTSTLVGEGSDDRRLEFDTVAPLEVGVRCAVALDLGALRALTADP